MASSLAVPPTSRATKVLTGLLTTLLPASLALLPRGAKVRMMARVMGGMTAHQPAPPARPEVPHA